MVRDDVVQVLSSGRSLKIITRSPLVLVATHYLKIVCTIRTNLFRLVRLLGFSCSVIKKKYFRLLWLLNVYNCH